MTVQGNYISAVSRILTVYWSILPQNHDVASYTSSKILVTCLDNVAISQADKEEE